MLQTQTLCKSQSTQKVVERLQAEGWVECPGLGFLAFAQQPLSDLRAVVLEELRGRGGRMELADLQLAVLVFSVPTHQYEVYPHLPWVLKRLQAEGVIEISQARSPLVKAAQTEVNVRLKVGRGCDREQFSLAGNRKGEQWIEQGGV